MIVLLLNVTGMPLDVISERRAWSLLARGRAVLVREAEAAPARSISGVAWPRPSVVYLTRHVPIPRHPPRWTRRDVLARDGHRCAYCGAPAHTVDHIYPQHLCRAEGRNPDTWENTVAACENCQRHKGGQPLLASGLRFRAGFTPRIPRRTQPTFLRVLHARPEWRTYVPDQWEQLSPE